MKLNIALVVAISVTLTAVHPTRAQAQTPPASTSTPTRPERVSKPGIPLRVVITLSTFQGEKKVSSLPYTLSVNAVEPPFGMGKASQVRMGAEVAVKGSNPGVPMTYKAIGTNIDCAAASTGDGRFALTISIEDSSIVSDSSAKVPAKEGEPPIFRSFRLSNEVVLRDGQSTQFTSATDRISGEMIRVEVTLTVIR